MSQWVTLLPEACTGAVCSLCKEHKDTLLKCGRCKRAWYCSKEHQKEDYPDHKLTCRLVAPFVDALIESVADIRPPPTSYAAVRTIIASATLYARRHGPQGHLSSNIFNCLSNTVFCRVCFKLREQLPPGAKMVCCPKCLWGWCCSEEHWQQHAPQHEQYCAEYATVRRLNLLKRQQAQADLSQQGGNQLPYPMGKVTQQQQGEMLEGWQQYRRLRMDDSVSNDDTWRCLTDDLAIPLTAVWASRLMYSQQQLAALQEFNLHLVGAYHFEFQHVLSNTAVEEVMHLLPAVKVLRVVLIGPELKLMFPGPTCSTHDEDVCPPCSTAGCKRITSIYRGTYEEYAQSKDWIEPTLAMACNSGVGCEEEESWVKAVKVLADKNVPCCFTSMNPGELPLDSGALQANGMTLLHQGRNTFSSCVPLMDADAGPDEFFYANGWIICCRGNAGSSSSSSNAGATAQAGSS